MPEIHGSVFSDALSNWETYHLGKFNNKIAEVEDTAKRRSAINELKTATRLRKDTLEDKKIEKLDFSQNEELTALVEKLRPHLDKHLEGGLVIEGEKNVQAFFTTLDNLATESEQAIPLRMMEIDALTKLNNLIVEMCKDSSENHHRLMEHINQKV